jgi:SAM-dependent methyltransferase
LAVTREHMIRFSALARIVRLAATRPKRTLATVYGVLSGPDGECPCCGHCGAFLPCSLMPAWQCPKCESLHRHRLLALALRDEFVGFANLEILHFAPEPSIAALVLAQGPAAYVSADIAAGRADTVLDIEAIALPDASIDMVIASHVLEHVDDRKALDEIWRILRPGGRLVAMVPIIEGWDETYEDKARTTPDEREQHFGLPGHLRYYGRESVRYRLKRGCKVFVATKDPTDAA